MKNKVKILSLTLLLLLVSGTSFAQTKEVIDSLKSILAATKNDTTKIYAQANLCDAYRFSNDDSSTFYGQQALKLARKINFIPGQILALAFLTAPAQQQGDYPKTLELGFEAIQLAKEHHLDVLAAPALSNMAAVYANLKDYQKAIDYSHQQILLELAGHIDRHIDPGLAYGYLQIGAIYSLSNQLDSAEYYEKKAVNGFDKLNYNEPAVYQLLGDIALKSGRNNEALHYYKISEQNAIKGNRLRALTAVYNSISEYFKTLNQPDSALYYAHKGLELSQDLGQKSSSLAAAKLLSGLYEQTNPKESLHYLKVANAYRDSLFGEVNLRAIQTIVAREKERQKEIQAAKVAYQNKLKLYLLLTGLFFLLLILFIIYRNFRKSKKANQALKKTLEDLKLTQSQLVHSEKMASLGELTAGIAHEIQNPLNFVNNFSEVSTELLEEMKENIKNGNLNEVNDLLEDVIQNLEKIHTHGGRADGIVKSMLQHSRGSSGEKVPTDINALANEYLRLSYHGLRAKDKSFNADFKLEADKSLPKIEIVPQDIGRVLLNLINNAFYAVSEKAKQNKDDYIPSVIVSTKNQGNNIEIRVKDNGAGIPESVKEKIFQPFFTTKPTGIGTGLGLSLSYEIITKGHKGKLKVQSEAARPDDPAGKESGTEFIITIPIKS